MRLLTRRAGHRLRALQMRGIVLLCLGLGCLACTQDADPPPTERSGATPPEGTPPSKKSGAEPETDTAVASVTDTEELQVETPLVAGGPTKPKAPTARRGLTVRLSETVEAQVTAPERAPTAQAARLDDGATQKLLKRLPPLKGEVGDKAEFKFRERSKPAPRTGETVKGEFPPSSPSGATKPTTQVEPLTVRRFSPEGDVPIAPKLSVTFSQPMVEVTSHDELAKKAPPVKMTPALEGTWRWVGTRTLLFETEARFKMATTYTVEIPAGIQSAVGGTLKDAVSWSFRTPPPKLVSKYPTSGPHVRRPVIYARFDQAINASDVLKHVSVSAGGKEYPVKMATAADLDGDPVAAMMKPGKNDLREQRQLAFRPVRKLPGNSTITVTFGKGTPSAEGDRTTEGSQSFSFTTFGPFDLRRARCGWGSKCPPLSPFSIEMTNPFDMEAFDPKQIAVSPSLEGFDAHVNGRWLTVRGKTKGRTTYKVTLKKSLRDRFGQTLEKDIVTSFRVTDAEPYLTAQGGSFIVLDPAAKKKTFRISSVNHDSVKVNLYRVTANDWSTWTAFARNAGDVRNLPRRPGKRVFSKAIQIDAKRDELVDTDIDLSPAFAGGLGQVVVEIEPTRQTNPRWRQVIVAWVQSTQMAVDAFRDGTDVHAWTTSLMTGKPLSGVSVRTVPSQLDGRTNADGLAVMPLGQGATGEPRVLVATKGDDVAILPESTAYWARTTGWRKYERRPELRWFVFDDRKLYKPKESVRVKGWIRKASGGKTPMVGALGSSTKSVGWVVKDSRNNDVAKGTAKLNPAGGFDFEAKLPDTMNLGYAHIELRAAGASDVDRVRYTHGFRVEEFRRPEFEVSTTPSQGPYLVGGKATVEMEAAYFAGGALPDTTVNWSVRTQLSSYTPPNRSDFSFGTWTPWWESPPRNNANDWMSLRGRTDSSGKHVIALDFEAVNPPRAASVVAEATVQDVNRQTFSSTSTLLVHPAAHYVGLRSKRSFIKAGETLKLDLIVVDIDGNAVVGRPIDVTATRMEWTSRKGRWTQEEKEKKTCSVTSAADAVTCKIVPVKGGQWRVTVDITDEQGRANQTRRTFWVAGGKQPVARKVTMEKATLIPSEAEYQPGDTAEILVQTPFVPAEGLMTIRVGGIVKTQRFTMNSATKTVKVPIVDEYIPDVRVKVDLVGAAPRMGRDGELVKGAPKRPAFASGQVALKVPPYRQTLRVDVTPADDKVDPGAKTGVTVVVKDAAGRPVPNAEVALVMVDEAVLALTGYRIPDPVSMFYVGRGYHGRDHYLRSSVLLVDPDELPAPPKSPERPKPAMKASKGMKREAPPSPSAAPPAEPADGAMLMDEGEADDSGGGSADTPIGVRKNFDALAAFVPAQVTDANGQLVLPIELPDNLTRYRITAVAVQGGKRFGKGEATVTARLPLMVRPSAPRFLNFGDAFELPVVLQNQTDEPLSVDVVVRSVSVDMTQGQGRRLTVPANDRVEVRFPAAVSNVGTARFQIGVAAGSFADAAQIELPVYTPATTEAFATYGVLDKDAVVQPVRAPGDVVKQFGGLEITTSSTALQALTDAVLYLTSYPYECAEQVSSRVMAVAALRDVLSAFEADGLPSPEELLKAVDRDIKKLSALQHGDGGFGFWKRSDRAWPYLSVHVAHALVRAKKKGFEVPKRMLNRSLSYLRDIERKYPSWYGPETRRTITSYALYVRQLQGDEDPGKANALIREWGGVDKTPIEPLGWLLSVLTKHPGSADVVQRIRRHLNNRVTETAGNAHWVTNYKDGAHLLLHSSRRADGILLDAIIGDQPKSDLIPKVVRGLLAHRKKGRWGNTQENAFVLLALDRYFSTYEKQTPDFVARVWLGDQYAGDHKFKGRTTERHRIDIPMNVLAKTAESQPLTLGRDGQGRMYYRIGMRYAPSSLKLEPADHGFTVLRRYEGVDDSSDVKQASDGTWQVKAGARVRVVLTMVAEARRYHVALVDQLPAGLEPMNPGLKGTQTPPPSTAGGTTDDGGGPYGRYWRWWGPWFEHQNLRDERAEAFTSLLWDGVYTYSYVTRATTPGQFVVPPAKAEEMYSPETFGRSATDRLHVVAP